MSEEQLKGFLEAVAADEGLQEQLKAAADTDAVVEIAKATGFVVSAEELEALVLQVQAEISEEELQGVAGGLLSHPEEKIAVGVFGTGLLIYAAGAIVLK